MNQGWKLRANLTIAALAAVMSVAATGAAGAGTDRPTAQADVLAQFDVPQGVAPDAAPGEESLVDEDEPADDAEELDEMFALVRSRVEHSVERLLASVEVSGRHR